MTANAFAEDKKKTMEAGMNAHLSKPLNVPELMDTIRKFCDGKQMCQRPGKEYQRYSRMKKNSVVISFRKGYTKKTEKNRVELQFYFRMVSFIHNS